MSHLSKFRPVHGAKAKLLMLLLTVALIVNMVAPAVAFSAAPVKTIPPAPLQTPTGSDAEVGCNNVRTLAMYDTLGRSTLHQSTGPELSLIHI